MFVVELIYKADLKEIDAHMRARAAIGDAGAPFDAAPGGVLAAFEAHGNEEPPGGPVDRLERGADLGEVFGARANDQLAVLPAQRAARLKERPQHRNHLIGRPVLQGNHLERSLRECRRAKEEADK